MEELLNFKSYPVNVVLKSLLEDKTTRKNIIFATNAYLEYDSTINETTHITEHLLLSNEKISIQPRVTRNITEQAMRTKKKAEVCTPSWICNKMNNHCDEEWFGKVAVFNTEAERDWIVNHEPVPFTKEKDWKKYVDSRRMEITCGEAPYIVSRYDAATGDTIPVERRIGILDRKLRVVNENAVSEDQWIKWTIRAFQSVYGYEFQGDNLLVARANLLITFVDYMQDRWNRVPTLAELNTITNIIVWNFWQMDGITGLVPFGKPKEKYREITLFDFEAEDNLEDDAGDDVECKIYNWRSKESITYNSMKEK